MSRRTVVRKYSKTDKPQLHALLMTGWNRCITDFGKGAFADALGITTPGIDKQLVGSMPDFETIMDAFDHDDTVLDDVFREKRKKLVDQDAVCDTDNLGMLLAQLHIWLEKARHPNSPGGPAIVHSEKLEGEALLRDAYGEIGRFLEECGALRRPRVAA